MACSWPVIWPDCDPDGEPGPKCGPLVDMTEEQRQTWITLAGDLLSAWTSGQFGLCEVTLRPCRSNCHDGRSTFYGSGPGRSGAPWSPALVGGQWFNISCGTCGDRCSCGHVEALTLPGPADSVVEVTIDGLVLDPAAYRIDNRRYLVRQDGGSWPDCQDLEADEDSPGTFVIRYLRGRPVPLGGQLAAGKLACELAKAACNDRGCELPRRVQSITRQDVSIQMLDTFDDLDEGRTGIWLIDSWLASVTKPARPTRVLSPDLPRERGRRTTWRAEV